MRASKELVTIYGAMGEGEKSFQALEQVFDRSKSLEKKKLAMSLLNRSFQLAQDSDVEKWVSWINVEMGQGAVDWVEVGDYWLGRSHHVKAVQAYKKGLERVGPNTRDRADLLERISRSHLFMGAFGEALKLQRESLKLTGRNKPAYADRLQKLADIYRRQAKVSVLLKKSEESWPVNARNDAEHEFLGDLYLEVGRLKEAKSSYESSLKRGPKNAGLQEKRLRTLRAQGDGAGLVKAYEELIALLPGEPQYRIDLALELHRSGNEKRAVKHLKTLEKRHSRHAWVLSTVAETYSGWGKHQDALRVLKKLTHIAPKETRTIVLLGEVYEAVGDTPKAEKTWKKILGKRKAENHAAYAKVLSEHDRLAEGVQAISMAIEKQRDQIEWIRLRAQMHERLKRTSQASQDWQTVFSLSSRPENEHYREEARNKVVFFLAKGNSKTFEAKLNEWKKTFAMNTASVEAGRLLLVAASWTGDAELKRETLEKLLVHYPNDPLWGMALVDHYEETQNISKAILVLERFQGTQENVSVDSLNRLADLKSLLHQDDEALQILRRSVDSNPKDFNAQLLLANKLHSLQRYDEAIGPYELSLSLRPDNPVAATKLAEILVGHGKNEKAVLVYSKTIRSSTSMQPLTSLVSKVMVLEPKLRALKTIEKSLYSHYERHRRDSFVQGALLLFYEQIFLSRNSSPRQKLWLENELKGKALDPALNVLRNDSNISQQKRALRLLAYLDTPQSSSSLMQYADSITKAKKNDVISKSVRRELRNHSLFVLGMREQPQITTYLEKQISAEDVATLLASMLHVGLSGDKTLLSPLEKQTKVIQRFGFYPVWIWALGESDAGNQRAKLKKMVSDPALDLTAQAAALMALGKSDGSDVELFLRAVLEERPELKSLAARALFSRSLRRSNLKLAARLFWLLSAEPSQERRKSLSSSQRRGISRKNIYDCFERKNSFTGSCLHRLVENDLFFKTRELVSQDDSFVDLVMESLDEYMSEWGMHIKDIYTLLDAHPTELSIGLWGRISTLNPRIQSSIKDLVHDRVRKHMKSDDQEIRLLALSLFSKSASPSNVGDIDKHFDAVNGLDELSRKDAISLMKSRSHSSKNKSRFPKNIAESPTKVHRHGKSFPTRYRNSKTELEKWELLDELNQEETLIPIDIEFLVAIANPANEPNAVLRLKTVELLKRVVQNKAVFEALNKAKSDPSFLVRFNAMSI